MRVSLGRKLFNAANYTFLILFLLSIIVPFMHIISVSISDSREVTGMNVTVFPKGFNFGAYQEILQTKVFKQSLLNTVYVTAATTFFGLLFSVMAAYALTKQFFGKKVINYIYLITMYFTGGLIPTYLLVSKYMGLRNTLLALILPNLILFFYIIILRSQIQEVPDSLLESARIDGANEFQVLFHVVIPSISATLAAVGMFIALGAWNSWFNVMVFNDSRDMWMLQYYLRLIITDKSLTQGVDAQRIDQTAGMMQLTPEQFQMAAVILVALPIVFIYPFVQKYFASGLLVGAVKG